MCFLRRAIYQLKQSLRAWFAKLSGLLSTFDFKLCTTNPTVLSKKTHDGFIILAVYVDDILLTGSDDISILANKTYLQQHQSTLFWQPIQMKGLYCPFFEKNEE